MLNNKLPVPSPHDSIKKRLTFGVSNLPQLDIGLDSHNHLIAADNYNGGFVHSLNTGKFHDPHKTPDNHFNQQIVMTTLSNTSPAFMPVSSPFGAK